GKLQKPHSDFPTDWLLLVHPGTAAARNEYLYCYTIDPSAEERIFIVFLIKRIKRVKTTYNCIHLQ
ncbi:hypothetical protein L9F63_005050, partial [Diploptera punctata]